MNYKEVLHYLGIFFLFITFVLGGLLLEGDALKYVLCALVLSFSVYYLVKLMLNKKQETHTNNLHIASLFVIYIVMSVLGGFLSLHFITVQWFASEDLKKNGNAKLETINSIRSQFNQSVDYATNDLTDKLSSSLEAYINAPRNIKSEKQDILVNLYKFDNNQLSSLNQQNIEVNAKTWVRTEITMKLDSCKKIDTELKNYFNKNKDIFNNMDYFKINKIYYELDSYLISRKKDLEDGFAAVFNKYDNNHTVFKNLTIPSSTIKLNSFFGLKKQYNSLTPIFLYLIIHILILFPFFVTFRKFKKPRPEEDTFTTLVP